ncbi:MAG: hypothetical protein ABIN91_03930 [Mucilaginibacter sp.]|uniref:hypothetical protein n=1 Tax=Mucilaginibacter sp. TaxID=1882438 RepID=UPI00326343F6
MVCGFSTIQRLMPAGDVRKKLFVGRRHLDGRRCWPTGLVYDSGGIQGHSKPPGASIGTSVLANNYGNLFPGG